MPIANGRYRLSAKWPIIGRYRLSADNNRCTSSIVVIVVAVVVAKHMPSHNAGAITRTQTTGHGGFISHNNIPLTQQPKQKTRSRINMVKCA